MKKVKKDNVINFPINVYVYEYSDIMAIPCVDFLGNIADGYDLLDSMEVDALIATAPFASVKLSEMYDAKYGLTDKVANRK